MRLDLKIFSLLAFFLKLVLHVAELRFNVLSVLRYFTSFSIRSVLNSRNHLSMNLYLL